MFIVVKIAAVQRDVAAAQVVLIRGCLLLAKRRVSAGKFIEISLKQKSSGF
ncbi:hypothetical protein [Umezakia ovalisporum]|uniref:Uncharacterized protein n=2 Tax=Umezakia ovalisporum TaxID=75695 RepID=A0AA43GVF5_9CYAN|nr:hypothetical protein [Umezakia ovalisporum]MDH6055370.1 hypothetical protein [Umezakia ovalisporum FSS-43]MDH6062543.1 hypothetical protein [Umezakia ovalisporum FSS-62]MDH6069940.1 hypothetical protein [Umezakia ovalisporum CobakiLakeA]MDH6083215.1 hypothetical protein [Umezakia ovalisporum FSS-44]MDH6083809.1 hypothetical protein [Umezakia ovalisporum TAC611]